MPELKRALLVAARALGLFRLSRRLTRNRLRILCYHGIWLDRGRANPFNFLYMQPKRFARRMALLQDLRYPVLPLGEALQRLEKGTLPPNAVAITIDDGWYGTFLHMAPELRRRRLPATIYLTTYHAEKQTAVFGVALQYMLQTAPVRKLDCARLGLDEGGTADLDDPAQREAAHAALCRFAEAALDAAGRERLLGQVAEALGLDWKAMSAGRFFHLMTLEEARACAQDGIDFQLHTHRHRVTRDGAVCIAEEVADNRVRLAQVSASPAIHFCYPSGNWHPEHFAALEEAGVASATTTDNGFCSRHTHRLALPRILDGDRLTEIEFEAELCGLLELKRMLRLRLSRAAP